MRNNKRRKEMKMTKIISPYRKLTLNDIEEFERRNNVILPNKYKRFMLENNGGKPEPHIFKISDEQGESGVTSFYTIDDGPRYDQLERYIDIYIDRLPRGFIPIGDDPGGNLICLGINEEFHDRVYFWDHEEENGDMSNMYFLANNIFDFINDLYDDEDDNMIMRGIT
jgi:hypothetical protein